MAEAPSFEEPVRILSDLHLGHPGGTVARTEQLRPMMEGAKTVIFNGDTLELRAKNYREESKRLGDELGVLLEELGVKAHYVTGNHDHRISERHYVDLCGGEVFVTHGHALFREVSPWGFTTRKAHEECLEEYERLYREHGGETLDGRMLVAQAICEITPKFNRRVKRGLLGRLETVINATCPPRRTINVLRTWMRHHRLARDFSREHRPGARFFVMGHTHFPGQWKFGDLVVINTGGYLSGGGARFVEVAAGELRVVSVKRDGTGRFVPGRVLGRYALEGGVREVEMDTREGEARTDLSLANAVS
jgi:predicted phosphodiesterase